MKIKKVLVGVTVVLMLAVFVFGAFVLSNKKKGEEFREQEVDVSRVKEVVLQDISRNYPPTPKEVLKFYSEITCCFYDENITEEDLNALADKARELYDSELLANQTREEYIEKLKEDVLYFQSQGLVISGYSVSASADVETWKEDGSSWARLYATYRLRQGTEYLYSNEVFILRKDSDGHWKIFGFELDPALSEEDSDLGEAAPSGDNQ